MSPFVEPTLCQALKPGLSKVVFRSNPSFCRTLTRGSSKLVHLTTCTEAPKKVRPPNSSIQVKQQESQQDLVTTLTTDCLAICYLLFASDKLRKNIQDLES